MKDLSLKEKARTKLKEASSYLAKLGCKNGMRLAMALLILGILSTSLALANMSPVFNSLTPDKAEPQPVGTKIRWTANATDPDGDPISYRFYLKGPSTSGTWQQVQDWGTVNFWDWTTSQEGNYEINVWIRSGEQVRIADSFDAFKIASFTVAAASVINQPPVVNTLTPNPSSPKIASTTVRWTASAYDPDGDPILYRFWLKGPSTGEAWQQVRDWSSTNFWDWTTSQPGNYEVNVWIRDGKHAGPDNWDAYKIETFTVSPAPILNRPPVFNSLTSNPPSPQTVGTPIRWIADATDPDPGDVVYYAFSLKGPSTGGAWQQVQDWSTKNWWDWVPSQQGEYEMSVWIRDGKHAGPDDWDAYKITPFKVNPAPVPNQPPVVTALSPNKPSPQTAGATIRWTASAHDPEGDSILYRFWLKGPSTGEAWQQVRDWSNTNFWDWTTSQPGNYEVNVWIRDAKHAGPDSWDAYKIETFTVSPAPVLNQPPVVTALSPNRPSPQTSGTTVRWTASAHDPDGDPILYRFWLKGPSTGEAWQQVRDWSNTNFWDWTTSQPGNYEVNVWIRDGKHAGPNNWDAYKIETFTVSPAPILNRPPVFNSLTSNPPSPQTVGSLIRWIADATDPDPGDAVYYAFSLKGPSTGGAWQQVQDWSTKNWWDWVPSQQGEYEMSVWIRDGNHAGPDGWDAYKITPFKVNPALVPNQPPVVTALSPNRPSPQTAGATVRWTASAYDPDGDPILYRFWLKGPSTGEAWQQVRDWSNTNFWDWTTSQPGNYEVNVWIRDAKHAGPDSWDAYKIETFTVTPAPISNQPPVLTGFAPDRPGPQIAGTTMRWTASAYDPDGDPVLYRFWMRGPSTGNAWKVVRDWSTTSTWTWSTSVGDAGQYDFAVYVRDGKHQPAGRYDDMMGYRGYQLIAIRPANLPPTVTALIPSSPSPSATGSTIVWTSVAIDPDGDTIFYRYWLRGPSTGDVWNVVRDWSTSSTWTWSTSPADAGAYDVYVYVRDGRHAPATSYDSARGFGGYQLTSVNRPPVVTALTPDRPSPQIAGTKITWTATATDPDGDPIFTRFWLRGPSTGDVWKVVQDWSLSPTWTWSPGYGDAGEYSVYVYVRDGNHAPATDYDSARGYSGYQIRAYRDVRQLTSGEAVQDRPSLVFVDDGSLLAYQSWEAGPLFRGDIFLKRFDPGWSQIQKVRATSDQAYQDTPSVIYSEGYYYVAYVSDETGSQDIFMKKYDLDFFPVETRRLTTSRADQDSPSLIRVDSDFYLAYQSWEMGPSSGGDIFIERFNPAWRSTRKVRVTTEASYQDRPSLTLGGDGMLYVAYVSEENGNKDIFVKKYDRSLNSLEKMRLNTSPSVQDYPSLLWQNGVFNLAYSSQEAGSLDLYMERFDTVWRLIDRAQLTGTSDDEIQPSLAFNPSDGLLWVAYVHQDGPSGNIFVRPAISMDSMAICWASMEFSATRAYSPYSITVKFRGAGGELADPSNLRLTWSPADAVLTSSTLQKVSTGIYQLDSRFGTPGQKIFTVSYTLAGCSGESTLAVQVT